MITDSRGKIPNYVYDNIIMTHQPTGLFVHHNDDLRAAHKALKELCRGPL